jgi:ABC-2 type transport system ATP-binding protein
VIELAGVSKTYRTLVPRRQVHALDDLTLAIHPGEVFGIAGPNGAGKTTLLALLLGFLEPTRGRVQIGGLRPRRYVQARGVAYVSELVAVPGWWTVEGALHRYATLAGVVPAERRAGADRAIEQLGIDEHRAKRVKHLSKGNLQRLGIAQALLGDFEVVVFDEPTHGLDPVWTVRFRDIVAGLRRPDRAIIIASHNLDELERLADRVAILDRGRLSRIARAGEAHPEGELEYRLTLEHDDPALLECFPGAERADHREAAYLVRGDLATLNRGLGEAIARGLRVRAFHPARSRLEAAFHEALGDG